MDLLIQIGFFLGLLTVGLLFGTINERRHYRRIEVKEAALPSIPLRRFGLPADIAAAVAFITSEEASYITGQVLAVDGGMSM